MKLAIGTAQFGQPYGVAGRTTVLADSVIKAILAAAHRAGIRTLDTAAAYGDIEGRLTSLCADNDFEVISKIPALPEELDAGAAIDFALAACDRSHQRLGPRLKGIMFHRSDDLSAPRGELLWAAVNDWARNKGIAVGASFYGPADCSAVSRERGLGLAQVPGNALDQRWRRAAECASPTCEFHLRSVFLQGLLLLSPDQVSKRLPVAATASVAWWRWCDDRGMRPLSAALAIAKGFPSVAKIVVGVDSEQHLDEILGAWHEVAPIDAPELAVTQEAIIDPRSWVVGPVS